VKNTSPGTLGWYYSNNNSPSSGSDFTEPFVANTDFPFTKLEYYNDGTEEVKRVISPGNAYRSTSDYKNVTQSKISAVTATDPDVSKWLQMRAEAFPTLSQPSNLLNNALKTLTIDEQNISTYFISDKSEKKIIMCHLSIDLVTNVTTKTCSFNFYDEAGRLKYQVSPNGVNAYPLTSFASIDKIYYEYNHQGRLILKNETDGGVTKYKHNKAGKVRFYQNSVQRLAAVERYNYINYDKAGRIVETGEYAVGSNGIAWTDISSLILENTSDGGLIGGSLSERVYTYYDGENGANISPYNQDFVRGQVSCTSRDNANTTWYNYDERGRIVWTAQAIPMIGTKKIEYLYNSQGNVKEVAYQRNQTDQYYHYYEYNEDGKLKRVYSGKSAPQYNSGQNIANLSSLTERAEYYYYLHGPLKRVEIGTTLQGIDYTYTIEGWLKSINNIYKEAGKDPGLDGTASSTFKHDLFGMSFDYYSGDYTKNSTNIGSLPNVEITNYYNGTIAAAGTQQQDTENSTGGMYTIDPFAYQYEYDDKYQLTNSSFCWYTTYNNWNKFINNIDNMKYLSEKNISYDANGNIKSLTRYDQNAIGPGIAPSQNFSSYNYSANANRLSTIKDGVTVVKSYTYDQIGQLKSVANGSVTLYVAFDNRGMMKWISKNSDGTNPDITYEYNDRGQRYKKNNYDYTTHALAKSTYYTYDVQGNPMSIYETDATNAVKRTEIPLYGSGRLGMYLAQVTSGGIQEDYLYEMRDHLGNVRKVITPNAAYNDGIAVTTTANYYPFGMTCPNNTAGITSIGAYRYGYQGDNSEKDESEFNAFDLRMYSSEIGRWISTDSKRQYYSPYLAMGNNPIAYTDPTGGNVPREQKKTQKTLANSNNETAMENFHKSLMKVYYYFNTELKKTDYTQKAGMAFYNTGSNGRLANKGHDAPKGKVDGYIDNPADIIKMPGETPTNIKELAEMIGSAAELTQQFLQELGWDGLELGKPYLLGNNVQPREGYENSYIYDTNVSKGLIINDCPSCYITNGNLYLK
jgi:RHS repeat-associated protein